MEIIKDNMDKLYKYFKSVISNVDFLDSRILEIFKLEQLKDIIISKRRYRNATKRC